jgi:uncharacterized repeat protein (TIGR03803 family)
VRTEKLDGQRPKWRSVGKFRGWRSRYAVFLLCATVASTSHAQSFSTLFSFDGTNGTQPVASLVQGLDGNFYGTTESGGYVGGGFGPAGTVFKITPSGTLTTLYDFDDCETCVDGGSPEAGLVLATDGNFYGTTVGGGANGGASKGTVFQITPGGTLTTLYSFCAKTNCADGSGPAAGLVQATHGNFYGTTSGGGSNDTSCSGGCGTVFKITPSGTLTTLYSFCSQANCSDGTQPLAGLVQAADGSLYGTTRLGGASGYGTTFKMSRSGILTTLHSFDLNDGAFPYAELVQGADGNFYGTTNEAGLYSYGTVFKMTPAGAVAGSAFDGAEGAFPSAGVVQATDGNFYGTTSAGGSGSSQGCDPTPGCGTIFKVDPKGVLTTLYSFCIQTNCPDGNSPIGGLVQGTDGNFYGTTSTGGSGYNGTFFRLSVGLRPFVKTLPTSGKAGASVIILGTNLTGATGVSFNGTAAAFTVVSSSEITTSVPSGATSGTVQVTAPSVVLLSNVGFRVRP